MAKVANRAGYESRKILVVGDITYVGSSVIGEPISGKWIIKKVEVVGDETAITFAEGAWEDVLTLIYL